MQQTIDRQIGRRNQQHAGNSLLTVCVHFEFVSCHNYAKEGGKKSVQTRDDSTRWPSFEKEEESVIEVARLKSWSRQFRRGKLRFPRKLDVTLLSRGKGRMLTNEESRENREGRGLFLFFLAESRPSLAASKILSRARHKSPVSLTGRRSSLSLPTFGALKVLCTLGNTSEPGW